MATCGRRYEVISGSDPGEPYFPEDPEEPPVDPEDPDPPVEVPTMDQRSAIAYKAKGSIAQWTTTPNTPYPHFGFTLGHGSWPDYDGSVGSPAVTGTATIWRNPNGSMWDEPGRYGSAYPGVGQDQGFFQNIANNRTSLVVPWGPSFIGAGGTQQGSSDNGIIILTDPDGVTGYEFQGLARLDDNLVENANIFQINLRCFGMYAQHGHYRCDGVYRRGGPVPPFGSQTTIAKWDTLLKPRHLDPGGWRDDEMIGLVGFNVNFGTGALHGPRPGDHVEHISNAQPYGPGQPYTFPVGANANMMRCGEGFAINITNAKIEQWIAASGATGAYAESKRNFARGCRGPVDIKGRPTKARIRLKESGTGYPILESVGAIPTKRRQEFAARGITTEQQANDLGKNILNYGTLVAI